MTSESWDPIDDFFGDNDTVTPSLTGNNENNEDELDQNELLGIDIENDIDDDFGLSDDQKSNEIRKEVPECEKKPQVEENPVKKSPVKPIEITFETSKSTEELIDEELKKFESEDIKYSNVNQEELDYDNLLDYGEDDDLDVTTKSKVQEPVIEPTPERVPDTLTKPEKVKSPSPNKEIEKVKIEEKKLEAKTINGSKEVKNESVTAEKSKSTEKNEIDEYDLENEDEEDENGKKRGRSNHWSERTEASNETENIIQPNGHMRSNNDKNSYRNNRQNFQNGQNNRQNNGNKNNNQHKGGNFNHNNKSNFNNNNNNQQNKKFSNQTRMPNTNNNGLNQFNNQPLFPNQQQNQLPLLQTPKDFNSPNRLSNPQNLMQNNQMPNSSVNFPNQQGILSQGQNFPNQQQLGLLNPHIGNFNSNQIQNQQNLMPQSQNNSQPLMSLSVKNINSPINQSSMMHINNQTNQLGQNNVPLLPNFNGNNMPAHKNGMINNSILNPQTQPFIPKPNFNSPMQQQQIRQSPPSILNNRPGIFQPTPYQNQSVPNMNKLSPNNNFINPRTDTYMNNMNNMNHMSGRQMGPMNNFNANNNQLNGNNNFQNLNSPANNMAFNTNQTSLLPTPSNMFHAFNNNTNNNNLGIGQNLPMGQQTINNDNNMYNNSNPNTNPMGLHPNVPLSGKPSTVYINPSFIAKQNEANKSSDSHGRQNVLKENPNNNQNSSNNKGFKQKFGENQDAPVTKNRSKIDLNALLEKRLADEMKEAEKKTLIIPSPTGTKRKSFENNDSSKSKKTSSKIHPSDLNTLQSRDKKKNDSPPKKKLASKVASVSIKPSKVNKQSEPVSTVTNMIIDDPEYTKKMEEQKRRREEILRMKEEKRRGKVPSTTESIQEPKSPQQNTRNVIISSKTSPVSATSKRIVSKRTISPPMTMANMKSMINKTLQENNDQKKMVVQN